MKTPTSYSPNFLSTYFSRLWDRIKLSLNDPQWGRKPGADSNQGSKGSDGDKPAEAPSASPTPPPPPPPTPSPTPSGGRGGQSGGPPDLDELMKKVNDRVGEIFGGKKGPRKSGGSGGPQFPSISPRFAAGGLVVAAVIGALLWLATGFYIVDEGKRGIVQRFGKYVETTEAGPRWHFPWPIETATIINLNQVRSVEIGFKGTSRNRDAKQAQMLTEDLNIIDIAFAVQYTLSDAKAFLFNHRNPEAAVVQAAETAMREVVGKRKMDFLLNQGREEFAGATQKLMQQLLDRYGTGITISKLNLQAVAAPEAVNEAFQDVVKAQQDRDRQVNEGQAYANRVIPEARGRASRLLEEASGYEQSVLTRAQGDAARFGSIVSEYNKSPVVTRERLYIDMMQSVLGNTSKILVDQKQGQSLLYLPLDKLMESTRASASGTTPSAVPEATRPPLPDPAAAVEIPGNRTGTRDSTRTTRESRN
jgi:modulator of FtsH protease HflK